MSALRLPFHLALALTLVSLTCGLGALCADMGEECCCMTADGSSPCTEMSGGKDMPVSPDQQATIDSGERFSIAVVDAAPLSSPGASTPARDSRAPQAAPAASTPLYLSHCAFLC